MKTFKIYVHSNLLIYAALTIAPLLYITCHDTLILKLKVCTLTPYSYFIHLHPVSGNHQYVLTNLIKYLHLKKKLSCTKCISDLGIDPYVSISY